MHKKAQFSRRKDEKKLRPVMNIHKVKTELIAWSVENSMGGVCVCDYIIGWNIMYFFFFYRLGLYMALLCTIKCVV